MRPSKTQLVMAAFVALAACDVVKFPGATEREERAANLPPPPPTEPVNPIPVSEDVLNETEGNTIDTSIGNIGDEPQPLIIDNLLTINAARCAQSPEETLTIAELTGATQAEATVTAQAVNGAATTTASFPGIVKMEPRRLLASGGVSSGHCGATRISSNWFVTAAHCLDNTYDEIRLIATESSLRSPLAVQVNATASICHASYGGASGQYANDVALVKISDADAAALSDVPVARYGATQQALSPLVYPRARMAGWGLTGFNGELSNDLLTAELDVTASGPAAITVASSNESGPCIGDSGGPLLVDEADGRPTVVGVLSVVEQNRATGEFCSGNYNARYTNLQGYLNWIDDVIGACNSSAELCAR
ncbi:MAG: trypsin-like serine protease [Pseudomonadota bacterium]